MLHLPVHFDDLLKLIDQLSAEQKRIISERLGKTESENQSHSVAPKRRVAGLHPGAIWTSDDFDDPLPDEFWLGEDA